MHPVRIGRIVRTLRRRRGWRQLDLAARAGLSQQAVSLVETGRCRRLSIGTLDRILAELEAEVDVLIRWRGGELDKVLDAGHATLEAALASQLVREGWLVEIEVTYSVEGDRGAIDLLAFHPRRAALVVAEIKTDLTSADATLRRHDEKVRLAAGVDRDRFDWVALRASRLLVLPEASTARRRVRGLAGLFDRVYPARGHEIRRWLHDPSGPLAGILFLSSTKAVGARLDLTARRRVSRSRRSQVEHDAPARPSRTERGFIDSSVDHHAGW
jgi:transcriptional regulator with XRE-family HTH domain